MTTSGLIFDILFNILFVEKREKYPCNPNSREHNAWTLCSKSSPIWYTLFSSRKGDAEEVYKKYIELEKWFLDNYKNGYKDIKLFKPAGENLKTRAIVKLIVILKKLNMLKIFLKIYVKI